MKLCEPPRDDDPYLRPLAGTFNRARGSALQEDLSRMAMDPKKYAELETKMLDHINRVRISPTGIRTATNTEYVAVKVMRDGDDIYLAAIEEGPKNVVGLRINGVVALHMAMSVVEAVKDLFPGRVQIEAIQHPIPPKGRQH